MSRNSLPRARTGRCWGAPAAAGWLLLAFATGTAIQADASVDRVEGPVPVPAGSEPYGASEVPGSPQSVALAPSGYVEEEYFVSGRADVHGRDARDARVVIRRAVPYVTRILVRRPADPARFSGVVHVEPLHPSFATTTTWPGAADYILRAGDAYVALGIGADPNMRNQSAIRGVPVAAPWVTRAFDPQRYAALQWPEEDGIRWDVIQDLVGLLRAGGRGDIRVLGGASPRRIFASGWSFSGSLWRTWINEGFHARASRSGARVDGYLIGISSRWNGGGYLPLNSSVEPLPVPHPRRALARIDAPVIEFLSEFEVASGSGPQQEDRDEPAGGHRLYELGGNVHGDGFSSRRGGQAGRTVHAQLAARGFPLTLGAPDVARPSSCDLPVADTPIGPLAAAMLRNLRDWVDDGRAPPRAAPLALDAAGEVRRDAIGNPLGGLRIAEFDVPWAAYGPQAGEDRPQCAATGPRPVFYRKPLTPAELTQRWGNRDTFLQRYDAAVDGLVESRTLLAEEAAGLKRRTRLDTEGAFEPPARVAAGFASYRPARRFAEQVIESFYLPLRDGTRVAVAIARPARDGRAVEGRFPVVWHHTLTISRIDADGTGGRLSGYRRMPSLTDHGYVVVQVARRGNGQSFGARRGYHERNEAHDAYEITEWLARQPWSSGKVAIYGCSNTGEAAMHALTVPSPHLKAVFAGCFSWNKYDGIRRGGIFAQWGTGPTRSIEEDMKVPAVDGDESKALLRSAAEEHQKSTSLIDLWKAMPFRDSLAPIVQGRFWGEGSVSSYAEAIRRSGIPVYIQGGWFDEFRDHGVTTFLNLPGQARLVLGPWLHCENDDLELLEEAHRFFDRHLKGMDTGIDADAPIHYYTVNAPAGTEWRSAQRWPLPNLVARRLRFAARGALLDGAGGTSGSTSFDANYGVACPDAGEGSKIQPCHAVGAGPSFATAPLRAPLEVTGEAVVSLWVSVAASDANVFAYLEDVAPDGRVTVVTEGRLKASLRARHLAPFASAPVPWHRSHESDAQPLVPGEPTLLEFGMLTTSWVFRSGHRLQVTISGADHRERAREGPAAPPRVSVLHDARYASSISLPTVPLASVAR